MKALIVEDNFEQAAMMGEILERAGLHVVASVQTEDSALEALERFAIDLAVIDLQLAYGTGFGVIRKLRGAGAHPVCIVVITNHAVPALKVAAFEAGTDYFFDKANGTEKVEKLLREAFNAMDDVRVTLNDRGDRTGISSTKPRPEQGKF